MVEPADVMGDRGGAVLDTVTDLKVEVRGAPTGGLDGAAEVGAQPVEQGFEQGAAFRRPAERGGLDVDRLPRSVARGERVVPFGASQY